MTTLVAKDGYPAPHISLPRPFASGDVVEWFQRYEICCRANAWDAEKKALKLPTLLEGEALAVWLELTEEQQKDYDGTKAKIIDAIMPMRFVSLDDFHKRSLLPGESLTVCPPTETATYAGYAWYC